MTSTLTPSSPPPTVERLRARILEEIAAADRNSFVVDAKTEPERATQLCTRFGLFDAVPDMLVAHASQGGSPSTGLAIGLVTADGIDAALTRRFDAYRATDGRLHWLIVEPSRAIALVGRSADFTLRKCGDLIFSDLGLRLSLDRLLAPDPEGHWPCGPGDIPLSGTDLPRFDTTEAFLTWYDAVPGKQRLELIAGQVRLARPQTTSQRRPHSSGHTRDSEIAPMLGVTHRLRLALNAALGARGDDGPARREAFTVLSSGLLVWAGRRDAFAPDLMVMASAALDRVTPEASFVEPLLVAEIVTRETAAVDTITKAPGYLATASVRHVLLIDPLAPAALHLERDAPVAPDRDGASETTVRLSHLRGGGMPIAALGIELDWDTVLHAL